MKKQTWVLLSLASVLVVFCAVRAVRSPAAAAGAPGVTAWEGCAPADENGTRAGFERTPESTGAIDLNAAGELHLRQLETAGKAQRMRQQEAANELQRRQQQAARTLS